MIQNSTIERNIVSTIQGVETSTYTIKGSGKMFRFLVDSVYSNAKGTIMREYAANARDSHVAAGCPDKPITVHLPTSLAPTLEFADEGLGLSREDVLDLYTTLGDSRKEDTNDLMGTFGIGSKSAFAYTDTFNIISVFNGWKGTFISVIGSDDIPTCTLVHEETTDEPNGLRIIIPVRAEDINAFRQEAERLALGHRGLINFNIDVKVPTPILSGEGWDIYGQYEGMFGVRMGSIVYPVDKGYLSRNPLTYACSMIIDVPIGSCSITGSREALKYDDATKVVINEHFGQYFDRILDDFQAEIDKATTLKGAMKARDAAERYVSQHNRDWKWNGAEVPRSHRFPSIQFAHIGSRGTYDLLNKDQLRFDPKRSQNIHVIVDRGQKLVRRAKRLTRYKSDFGYGQRDLYVMINPTNRELSRFIDIMEIPARNIISIDAIPDEAPEARERVKATGVYNHYRVKLAGNNVPEDVDLWLPLERGNSVDVSLPGFGMFDTRGQTGHYRRESITRLYVIGDALGLERPHMLTKMGQTAYAVDASTRYDVVLRDILDGMVEEYGKWRFNNIVSRAIPHRARQAGIESIVDFSKPISDEMLAIVDYNIATNYLTAGSNAATIDLYVTEANDLVAKMRQTWPLLFDGDNLAALIEYMEDKKEGWK